jgi:hypothetical protein
LPCNSRRAFPLLRLAFPPLRPTTRSLHLKKTWVPARSFSQPVAGQPQQTLQRIAKMVHATDRALTPLRTKGASGARRSDIFLVRMRLDAARCYVGS